LPEESEVDGGQAAHVYDMAILPSFQGKGLARKMIDHVLDIATAYNMPIEAEARASTSYAMLMNERVRHLFESRGFVLTHNEKKEKYLGGEDFYFVRFENKGAPAQEE
jgi:GNAT superfamily N-acetyltransferase